MLTIYLNSNESLKLHESFKLYLTILSIEHQKFKAVQGRKHKKRTAQFYKNKKVHVGCNSPNNIFKRSWALDFPISYPKAKLVNIFMNKCLLLCVAIALLQHSYFENRIENKSYIYAIQINSPNENKKRHAGNILASELVSIIDKCKISESGPFDLIPTFELLFNEYKCQFFVFSGLANKKKLEQMYPITYDDSLKPIYLYHQHDSHHLIFIKNINAYFKANYRVCFACHKSFSTANYRHLCAKRECCFACRRFYQNALTYCNTFTINNFCDRFLTNQTSFDCPICNLTIFSKHCLKGHRKLCYGKGYLGWKCKQCNKFFYRHHGQTSDLLKQNHTCSQPKMCRFCFEPNSADHLCRIKKCVYPKTWPILGFLAVEFIDKLEESQPFLVIAYLEKDPCHGAFKRYVFSDLPEYLPNECNEINFFNYYPTNLQRSSTYCCKKSSVKQDFQENLKKLRAKDGANNLKIQLLQFLMARPNVTYLCQDENSILLVSEA